MSTIYQEAKKRLPSQKESILRLLREAGAIGVTNARLTKVAMRYGAPLGQLYQDGYKIETVNLGDGIVKYILRSEPSPNRDIKEKATDAFSNMLENSLGKTIAKEIMDKMSNLNITTKYKAGTFK